MNYKKYILEIIGSYRRFQLSNTISQRLLNSDYFLFDGYEQVLNHEICACMGVQNYKLSCLEILYHIYVA